jgi:uncharacterized protein (TIGR02588 family)
MSSILLKPETEPKPESPKRTAAEWVTFSFASVILGGILGLVIYSQVSRPHQPPILTIASQEPIRQTAGQFYVPFEVTNTGGETAASVQLIAELRINGRVEETGEQQIDFLSRNEKEVGAFIFSRDPNQGQLTLRVASYQLP